ncbi:MAG: 30S ribosomal protein S17 [Planctomycetota bacterium]|jgi:small subunit ribosomal protein S17
MARRILIGVVKSDRMNKSRRVEIERFVRHPKYTKIVRRKTVCHVHDEENQSRLGDKVEIEESRPISKLKRWRLIRVVEKSKEVGASEVRSNVQAS